MRFSFRTQFYNIVDILLERAGFTDFALGCDDTTVGYVAIFEDDKLIRELYQWSAAAFACGLIESPRIERM
jgi:hypothetical protein